MTSALSGRERVVQNVTIVLIGCVNGTVTRGGGGPKIGKFCGRHLWMAPKSLEGFLESGPQFILQSYILLRGEKLGYEDLTSVEASE